MSHVRKLYLDGSICERGTRVSSYYSWPRGETQMEVEKLIAGFKRAFCSVTVKIVHNFID
jgi:hypothetical protein